MKRKSAIAILTLLTAAVTAFAQTGPPPGGPPPPGGGPGGGAPGGGSAGDGIWRRNAYYGELLTFDACVGHQPQTGQYHYHASPTCLRAQLNDNLVTVRNSRTGVIYQELLSGWHHSPILGWAPDGYPIYGPYGYSNPNDATSPIKRMVSGFQLRNITQRTTLPTWSLPNHTGISQTLTSSQYGPNVSTTFPLGRYVEDYDWIQGAGDLDQYNGRFTVTPEFPNGAYAYYATIDANGTPAFPFVVAGQYYGVVGAGFSSTGSSSATEYFNAASPSTPASTAPIPKLTSWSTQYSSQAARVVSGFDPSAGPSTTWPAPNTVGVMTSGSVSTPTMADAQKIQYTASTVYVTSNNLAGYVMGPWFSADMKAGVFNNFPSSSPSTFQVPLNPAEAATHSSTGMGPQGMWVNGVVMFNFLDGASYINATGVDGMAGNTPALDAAITSAASYEQGPQAPGSLVTAFPLFFTVFSSSLSNTSVLVKDSSGATMPAQVLYTSPSQLNFLMPTGLATGAGAVTITAGGSTITSNINIQPVYPNLFLSNVTAQAGAYLTLYGSGLGNATSATATIGGVPATVTYAGPQGQYPGLDQYNILVPQSLAGAGKVDVVVTAGGKPSNPVTITL